MKPSEYLKTIGIPVSPFKRDSVWRRLDELFISKEQHEKELEDLKEKFQEYCGALPKEQDK